ncbi:restriction endonuclease subunit S [Streptomyces salyersiae]|uniref:Restriction endonuclease subunit S n=1 Tax=Streptomyces salyersiae TaxID=3075530 RepID=A0ABU2RG80_9ACTN|nr:restriction endonuclease subunit S [Streptomyces sp. DSM 41770]MDT0427867.1 restriction endonuclease subunit S [Streptomyces sp. DSM 41770]
MDAFAGAVGVSDSDGKSTPVYAACKPRPGVVAEYYALLIRHMALSGWITALAKGIRERSTDFRFSQFGSQHLPVPPLEEQQAIVKYVRHIEREVGAAVIIKRKLIALLDEQRTSVIEDAVKRGAPGAITEPDLWNHLEVKRVASLVTSGSRGWATYYSDTGDWFLQSGNIGKRLNLKLDKVQCVKIPDSAEGIRTRAREGDLLVCITGAMTGNIGVVQYELPYPSYVNQHVALVRPRPELINSEYLALALHSQSGQQQFKMSEYGGTKQGLGLAEVKSARVPVPPLDAQVEIVQYVAREARKIEFAISRTEREISLLREYQNRLTADVVTGKLDVRAASAALPDLDPYNPSLAAACAGAEDGLDANALDGDDTTEEST